MAPEFRVWHPNTEELEYLELKSYDYGSFTGLVDKFGDDQAIWEPYTRFKDNMGEKIYEGDIVSILNHPFQKYIGIEGNYKISWGDRDLSWLAGPWKCSENRPYLTVIGNIHENLELLEALNDPK
jgi:hypothetical protein